MKELLIGLLLLALSAPALAQSDASCPCWNDKRATGMCTNPDMDRSAFFGEVSALTCVSDSMRFTFIAEPKFCVLFINPQKTDGTGLTQLSSGTSPEESAACIEDLSAVCDSLGCE